MSAAVASQRRQWIRLGPVLALAIAAAVLAPILAVVAVALGGSNADWGHLWATTLPRYAAMTVIMIAGVGAVAALIGTACAWLVTHRRFPFHGLISVMLLAPMAIPAYVSAFALVDLFEFAGPVQTGLRGIFGWSSPADYWFPEIRSPGAAVLVLGLALYPYVYLFARDAFEDQGARAMDVARSLGQGPWGVFWRTSLPLARPAIVASTAIVMMEVLNDFGTMDYFAIQTLTTGIFTQWLEASDAGAAAQIASLLMVAVLVLTVAERIGRNNSRFDAGARGHSPVKPVQVTGAAGWALSFVTALPLLLGFVLPVIVLLTLARPAAWVDDGLWRDGLHTFFLVGSRRW